MFLLIFCEKEKQAVSKRCFCEAVGCFGAAAIGASRVSSGYSVWILKPKPLHKLDAIPRWVSQVVCWDRGGRCMLSNSINCVSQGGMWGRACYKSTLSRSSVSLIQWTVGLGDWWFPFLCLPNGKYIIKKNSLKGRLLYLWFVPANGIS